MQILVNGVKTMDLEKKIEYYKCIWFKSLSIDKSNPMYSHCVVICDGFQDLCLKYQPKEIETKFKPKFKFMSDKYEI